MIHENLKIIRQAIEQERSTASCALIAVSKQQPDWAIDQALALGLRQFGENRVQEAQKRWQPRRALYPDLRLHYIGPLQSNKAQEAVALFDIIHTVDRPKIALALRDAMVHANRFLPCFIQVNTGCEPQKSGVDLDALPDFLHYCRSEAQLNIIGLMCIPPVEDDPSIHFAALQHAAQKHDLPNLSMGMSGDYKIALNYGATHLRIGSALFGE